MILDNEEQRTFILEMFNQLNFPGQHIELAVGIKRAVQLATVEKYPRLLTPEELASASTSMPG